MGIAGVGTVGCGVIHILESHADLIARRAGKRIRVSAVSARDPGKKRPVDLSPYAFMSDARSLVMRDDVDVVLELMGGDTGAPHDLIKRAIEHKKPVVTANKALLARAGVELSELAHQQGTPLLFEAAVGGGVPMVKVLREAMAANSITTLAGILNGTCNYILTAMERTGREFDDVLREAQTRGYAEADPTLDVDGLDSAHKLAILISLITGMPPDVGAINVRGIRDITLAQIEAAAVKGYRIKLLGIMRGMEQMVEPCLVPLHHPLATVCDADNALSYHTDHTGTGMVMGHGAGALPTASAVIADVIDIAMGRAANTYGLWPLNGAPIPAHPEKSRIIKDHDLGLRIWGA